MEIDPHNPNARTNAALAVLADDVEQILRARGAWKGSSPLSEGEIISAEGAFRVAAESAVRLLDREDTAWRRRYG